MGQLVSKRHFLLEQWSKSVAEITFAVGTDMFVPTLLAGVKRLVDFDFIMGFAYSGEQPPLALGDTLDSERHGVISTDYVAGPFLLDPFYQLALRGKNCGCHRLHQIAPDHFRNSEYFNVHYGRTGIGEEVGFYFDLGANLTGVMSLSRWSQSPPIVPSEFAVLEAVESTIGAFCARHWSNIHGALRHHAKIPDVTEQFGGSVLSVREREIVAMILQGHSTESIALQLDISPGTVKIHRKNTYRKLKVSSQAELFAAFLNFVTPASRQSAYTLGDMAVRKEIPHNSRK